MESDAGSSDDRGVAVASTGQFTEPPPAYEDVCGTQAISNAPKPYSELSPPSYNEVAGVDAAVVGVYTVSGHVDDAVARDRRLSDSVDSEREAFEFRTIPRQRDDAVSIAASVFSSRRTKREVVIVVVIIIVVAIVTIFLATFLSVPSNKAVTAHPLISNQDGPRKSCSGYCPGSYNAQCVNGFCECSKSGYNRYTCLPEVGNCRVTPNNPNSAATATLRGIAQTVFSCVDSDTAQNYEVHVLSIYEGNVLTQTTSSSTTNLHIQGVTTKPIVLVLSSYKPVHWVIYSDNPLHLTAVQLFSYYDHLSSVDLSNINNSKYVLVKTTAWLSATGDDADGGDTVGLLNLLNTIWGPITSFSGCHSADVWILRFGENTVSTPMPSVTWDKVRYERKLFLKDETFTVPSGVTKVDVICIGGGGAGRNGQIKGSYGGDGSKSTFGSYLRAEGGKGATKDNTGGAGGYGSVAVGGQGEIGEDCGIGGGAAGQINVNGGRSVQGSSSYPYCGGGGSSCDRKNDSLVVRKSGPGGVDPVGRDGGLYGGGSGGQAGGRAGGGGGYSRSIIEVVPGQNISIEVGEAGFPNRWGGTPGQGVVIISWGGPVDLCLNQTETAEANVKN